MFLQHMAPPSLPPHLSADSMKHTVFVRFILPVQESTKPVLVRAPKPPVLVDALALSVCVVPALAVRAWEQMVLRTVLMTAGGEGGEGGGGASPVQMRAHGMAERGTKRSKQRKKLRN